MNVKEGLWPKYELRLDSGRNIELHYLQQCMTYGGLLSGLPCHGTNKRLLDTHLGMAERWLASMTSFALKPLMIPPVVLLSETTCPMMEACGRGIPEFMPGVLSIALFDSSAVMAKEMCSSVLLVWYQDMWGLPTCGIARSICEIDWEAHAYDWSY